MFEELSYHTTIVTMGCHCQVSKIYLLRKKCVHMTCGSLFTLKLHLCWRSCLAKLHILFQKWQFNIVDAIRNFLHKRKIDANFEEGQDDRWNLVFFAQMYDISKLIITINFHCMTMHNNSSINLLLCFTKNNCIWKWHESD